MTSRALRFALGALVLAAIVGAAYVTWRTESEDTTAAAAARSFETRIRAASRALLDIKSAQAGYVAAGQGDDFWTARVDALLAPARDGLTTLRSQAHVAQAQSDLDNAAAVFEDFEQMDRRVRDYARNGQRLLASDLVFSDGIEKLDAAVAALDRARDAEWNAYDTARRQRRRTQLTAAVGSAALGLLALMLLTPLPRTLSAAPVETPQPADATLDYSIARGPLAPSVPVPSPAPQPIASSLVERPPATTTLPIIDLPAVASLCTDLSRVVDTRALPAALERAAAVLDASGIVVWIADPDGRELAPIIAHGYPQNLVSRLGTIPHDAENVTAAAFRTGVVQTVRTDSISHGAIAAPLLTPAGPVGVMAAEMRNEAERNEATRAAATIIAAQLATLMGPPSSRSQVKAEAAGA